MKDQILSIINADDRYGFTGFTDISKLKALISEMNTVDIAEIFEELDKEKIIELFRILPKDMAADVFTNVDSDQQRIIVEALTDLEIGEIMSKIFVDDAVDFIEEMPANVVNRVLQNAGHEKRRLINQILKYPDDSAGSIMTTEYVDLRENATVHEAFETIRKTGLNKETIYNCYVMRWDRMLLGVVSAKTLMLANPEDRIGDIMDTNIVFAYTTDDQEAVTEQFQKYGLLAMPVVDKEQRLVGIITVDDIVDIIVEESTEDMERLSALAPSDDPYLKTGIVRLFRNRFLWLTVLMLSATITGTIIQSFESQLAVLPFLMAFIPMLMNTGGIAGTQSSTLVIRGMAVGEIRLGDFLRVVWKEIRVAFLCGVGLALINMTRIYVMYGRNIVLAMTVSFSLVCTIMMAKTAGSLLPMIAKRLRLDPAIMAAPLITTMVDACSLIIYFSIAKVMFNIV